jgi:hypothetical protein
VRVLTVAAGRAAMVALGSLPEAASELEAARTASARAGALVGVAAYWSRPPMCAPWGRMRFRIGCRTVDPLAAARRSACNSA